MLGNILRLIKVNYLSELFSFIFIKNVLKNILKIVDFKKKKKYFNFWFFFLFFYFKNKNKKK